VSAHVCGDQSAGDVRDNFTKLKKIHSAKEQTFQVKKNSLGETSEAIEFMLVPQISGMPSDEIVRRGLVRREIPVYGGVGLAAALSKAMQREDEQ
jgi:hypothetical protein